LGSAQIERIEDLQSFCASAPIGKAVNARLIRAGSLIELSIVPTERPRKGS
jgi:S1-C subfamily serine protease